GRAGIVCREIHGAKYQGCRRLHIPNPKPRGYPSELRRQAVVLTVGGHSNRGIARMLKLSAKRMQLLVARAPRIMT
ncbi:MAG: hypothetical protein RML99_09970, partial [Anaerolineae bacterium]|nr:hypothetical protein [Anaerolineae bacterium]